MAEKTTQSLDTPNIQASQAGLILHSTTRIAAPAALVFRTLRNTETWRDWNKFVPRVNITHQPPDDDLATAAEIEELVRNTSIAGSYDSDLTDGLVNGGGKKRLSESGERPETPPLRLRVGSQASRGGQRNGSESVPDSASSPAVGAIVVPNDGASSPPSSDKPLSGAQKYAAAQANRKASLAAGSAPEPVQNNLQGAPSNGSSPRTSLSPNDAQAQGRRKSRTPSLGQKMAKARQQSFNMLYGEPSVRLQLNTKMTFLVRMSASNPRDFKQTHLVVTEVSRPDDTASEGSNLTALTRSKTHTLSRTPMYRIVWAMDHSMSSMSNMKNGSAFPKSLLQTERVTEIRPITLGDGSEECEYRTWELQKGPLVKVVKKKYGEYLQEQFVSSGKGLAEFCEAMTGKVDRRDFSVVLDEDLNPVGVITF